MSRRAVQSLELYLRRVPDEAARQADAQLLRQFTDANDHRAFEALLDRHGPMVLGTARRLVANAADADDVFQAVFLSLTRRAKSIRQGQSLPSWLYTTTCRIAARSRTRRAASLESAPEPNDATPVETDLVWREVRVALDEELQRLPERLRSPLLLCFLSGLTRDEAAEQLGWSLSTLRRRLDEGRTVLRTRLERRGVSAAGLALAVLSPAALDAAVRPALARACLDALSGTETAAVSALALTSTTTFKGLAMKVCIVVLALVSLGIGIYSNLGSAAPPKPAEEKKTPEPPATAKRVDASGDPLPDGAIMRLGTRRFRAHLYHPALPFQWHYLPDGKSYLVRHSSGTASEIRRSDAKTGAMVESWPIPKSRGDVAWAGRDDEVVGFSPDGRYALMTNDYIHHGLVEEAQQWHFTLYDLMERKQVWSVSKKLEPKDWPDATMCVFSADNKWLVTGRDHGQGKEVRLWDAQTGKQLWQVRNKGQTQSLSRTPIGFVDDGETVVLRDYDGTVSLFDRARGTEKKSFPTAPRESWGQTLLSPDGKHLVICTLQPPSIWNLDGKKLATLEGHKSWANVAAISPDGKKLFTGCFDSFVIEREFPSGKPIRKLELGRDRVMKMAVSPDGKRLEVVFEGEHALIFYDLETGKQLPESIASHRSIIYGVECAPDGLLISFGADRSVHTWDLKQGESVAQFAVDLDLNGRGFALSPDGTRIAVPNDDVKSIGIYERVTGKRLRNIQVDHFSGQQLAFSPDGRFLASIVGDRRSAQVWDLTTGAVLLKVLAGNTCNTVVGAFSPDGRTFAFGDGGQIRMWDTATWKEGIGIPVVAPSGLERLEYSPDGRTIGIASWFGHDGVRLYEVATRRERAHVQPQGKTTGALRFSHNGRLLAWVNGSHQIHVLDVRTGVLAGPFTGHDGAITGLTFTMDDKALASSSADCTILIWDVSAKTIAAPAKVSQADEDWEALRGEDARKAFTAIRRLAADPATALKIAGEHLKPARPIDAPWVAARLRDLDSSKFAERDRATRDLEDAGDGVAVALEQFLETKPAAEARQRAEKLLAKIRGRIATDRTAQSLRALEVLEWLGTANAREVVEKLAKGADGTSVTEEAKRSLKRWRASAE
jgi:RNA polymerase sigma factor (sigma-70 family)